MAEGRVVLARSASLHGKHWLRLGVHALAFGHVGIIGGTAHFGDLTAMRGTNRSTPSWDSYGWCWVLDAVLVNSVGGGWCCNIWPLNCWHIWWNSLHILELAG